MISSLLWAFYHILSSDTKTFYIKYETEKNKILETNHILKRSLNLSKELFFRNKKLIKDF